MDRVFSRRMFAALLQYVCLRIVGEFAVSLLADALSTFFQNNPVVVSLREAVYIAYLGLRVGWKYRPVISDILWDFFKVLLQSDSHVHIQTLVWWWVSTAILAGLLWHFYTNRIATTASSASAEPVINTEIDSTSSPPGQRVHHHHATLAPVNEDDLLHDDESVTSGVSPRSQPGPFQPDRQYTDDQSLHEHLPLVQYGFIVPADYVQMSPTTTGVRYTTSISRSPSLGSVYTLPDSLQGGSSQPSSPMASGESTRSSSSASGSNVNEAARLKTRRVSQLQRGLAENKVKA